MGKRALIGSSLVCTMHEIAAIGVLGLGTRNPRKQMTWAGKRLGALASAEKERSLSDDDV